MAQYEHLSIYKKSFDLKVYVENIVRDFSRYNKYTLGSELRNISMEIENFSNKKLSSDAINSPEYKYDDTGQLHFTFSRNIIMIQVGNKYHIRKGSINQ